MSVLLEFLLPRRPLSHQSGNTQHKQAWRDFVYGRAHAAWKGTPLTERGLKFTVVYLCEAHPIDINNVIKPIQDALNSLVYADDSQVTDVTGHLRYLSEPTDILTLPPLLADAVVNGVESVYVRVATANPLHIEVMHA
jgi:crossover junction endodeoxyribonuclease RusA